MQAFLRQSVVDRGARHVKRLRLRLPDSTGRSTAQMLVEEVLRLTSLPGEDQGRVYFFRRLRLPPMDRRQPASDWIARGSRHLLTLGREAVAVSDPRSAAADAVFFGSAHEARRLLLARLLRGDAAREWYWARATGVPAALPLEDRIEQLLDYWHVQEAGWAGVARELLPSLDRDGIRRLLERIRRPTVVRWLSSVTSGHAAPSRGAERSHATMPRLRSRTAALLDEARQHLADDDPRVVFLAVLAVLEAAPDLSSGGDAQQIARSVLDAPVSLGRRDDASMRDRRGRRTHGNAGTTADGTQRSSARDVTGARESEDAIEPSGRLEHATEGAGVYFLLHALRHTGIVPLLDAHAELRLTHFVARVLLRLARQAGVAFEDPILQPLLEDIDGLHASDARDPLARPPSLSHLQRLRAAPELTERLWACAVRRWCRRHMRMSVREILARPGRIRATPTNIDITLPMSAVDLRIRRVGLDLDPGYVPWFARVVHFHYDVEGGA